MLKTRVTPPGGALWVLESHKTSSKVFANYLLLQNSLTNSVLKKETHFSLLIWNNQSYWLFMYFLTNIPFHKISTFITQVIIWIELESIKINVWLLEKPFALNSLKQNQAVLHWREKLTSTYNGHALSKSSSWSREKEFIIMRK